MALQAYEHCGAWRSALRLVEHVYALTDRFPDSEKSGLTATLRRSVAAASAKLAEAIEREAPDAAAKAVDGVSDSLMEIDAHVLIAQRLGYVSSWRTGRVRRRIRHLQRDLRRLAEAWRDDADEQGDDPPLQLAA